MEYLNRPIRAGELNQHIIISRWQDVPNDAFGLDQQFDSGFSCWAKHEPIHGLALRAGMQTGESPTDLFWVRVPPGDGLGDITAEHVIEWRRRRYRVIDTILTGNRLDFLRITAKYLGVIP